MPPKYTLRQYELAYSIRFTNLKEYTLDDEFELTEIAKIFDGKKDAEFYDWTEFLKAEEEAKLAAKEYFEPLNVDELRAEIEGIE